MNRLAVLWTDKDAEQVFTADSPVRPKRQEQVPAAAKAARGYHLSMYPGDIVLGVRGPKGRFVA